MALNGVGSIDPKPNVKALIWYDEPKRQADFPNQFLELDDTL